MIISETITHKHQQNHSEITVTLQGDPSTDWECVQDMAKQAVIDQFAALGVSIDPNAIYLSSDIAAAKSIAWASVDGDVLKLTSR